MLARGGLIRTELMNTRLLLATTTYYTPNDTTLIVNFKLIYFSSICEASSHNLFKSLSSPLPGTSQYWCDMRNHGRGLCVGLPHDS